MTPKPPPAITEKTFEAMVKPWLTGIAKKDLVAVMSYPASDRQRRLINLQGNHALQKKYLPKSESYIWITVDYRVDSIPHTVQLEELILTKIRQVIQIEFANSTSFSDSIKNLKIQTGKKVILLAFGCEKILKDKRADVLIWSTIQQRLNNLRQILFFEANLLSTEYVQFLGTVPAFQPRISTMKLYDRQDVFQFMDHMAHEWNFTIPRQTKAEVHRQCGGMLLLVKEALWYIRDTPSAKRDLWTHLEMQFNLAALWHGFDAREQAVLQNIAHAVPLEDHTLSPSIHYLLLTGIIAQKHTRFSITVPLLERYIQNKLPKTYSFSLSDGSILLNGVPINGHFSTNERATLKTLIKAEGKTVGRETLADLLWPENMGNYSDWALDSIISRIRKKLAELGVPNTVLSVQKKVGIRLQHQTYE